MKSNDIVLTKIFTTLNFDKDKRFWSIVRDAVSRTNGNVDGLPSLKRELLIVKSDFGRPRDYDPMLGALRMFLITESFPW
jgi:hypothetical protein